MKVFSLGLNVLTGGAWGVARWFFGLFKPKEGKRTFFGAVMIWLVGHSLFLMMTGAISPWAILRGVGYVLATTLTFGGYEVKPPQEERTAIQRAQEAIDHRLKQVADAAEEKARKIREEADAKVAEIQQKFEHEATQRGLEHKIQSQLKTPVEQVQHKEFIEVKYVPCSSCSSIESWPKGSAFVICEKCKTKFNPKTNKIMEFYSERGPIIVTYAKCPKCSSEHLSRSDESLDFCLECGFAYQSITRKEVADSELPEGLLPILARSRKVYNQTHK
jgi:ribosomal protein L37AE/L43A